MHSVYPQTRVKPRTNMWDRRKWGNGCCWIALGKDKMQQFSCRAVVVGEKCGGCFCFCMCRPSFNIKGNFPTSEILQAKFFFYWFSFLMLESILPMDKASYEVVDALWTNGIFFWCRKRLQNPEAILFMLHNLRATTFLLCSPPSPTFLGSQAVFVTPRAFWHIVQTEVFQWAF